MLALNLISLSIKYAKLSFHLLNHYLYRIKLCDWNMQKQLTTIDVPSNFHITFIPYFQISKLLGYGSAIHVHFLQHGCAASLQHCVDTQWIL